MYYSKGFNLSFTGVMVLSAMTAIPQKTIIKNA
jgi:hypothetical protein